MTTLLRRHREQYLQKSRFTRHLQYIRDVGPFYIVTKPTPRRCELDLGILEGFRQKLEIGWGEAFFGDDHDSASRTARTISPHPSMHTPHTTSNKPSYTEVWALGVLASLFLMLRRCCASGVLGVLKPHLRFARYLQHFSYYPTTCGLAVSSLSSWQLQLQLRKLSPATSAAVPDREPEPLRLLQLSQLGHLEATTAQPGWSKCSWEGGRGGG